MLCTPAPNCTSSVSLSDGPFHGWPSIVTSALDGCTFRESVPNSDTSFNPRSLVGRGCTATVLAGGRRGYGEEDVGPGCPGSPGAPNPGPPGPGTAGPGPPCPGGVLPTGRSGSGSPAASGSIACRTLNVVAGCR